jgi:hypothetical protein
MRCNLVLKSLLLLSVLLIAAVALAAPAANDQSTLNSVNALRTYLQPDLTLKSALSPDFLPPAQGPKVAFSRTCRCSCGFPCKTNADCGPGGICTGGITCCNQGPKGPQAAWLQAAALSSRSSAAPQLNSNCK